MALLFATTSYFVVSHGSIFRGSFSVVPGEKLLSGKETRAGGHLDRRTMLALALRLHYRLTARDLRFLATECFSEVTNSTD